MIISIANNKGGVLKTTLTVNIAGVLAKDYDKKVLLIDADGQNNIGTSFGINTKKNSANNLYDVMFNGADIQEGIMEVHPNIHILPSGKDFDNFELAIIKTQDKNAMKKIKHVVDSLKDQYDYILLDTPPKAGLIQLNALISSDKVIIPLQLELYAIQGIIDMFKTIEDVKGKYKNPKLEISAVVPTLVNKRTNLHNHMYKKIKKICDDKKVKILPIEKGIPNSIRTATELAESRTPSTLSNKKTPINEIYKEIVEEII